MDDRVLLDADIREPLFDYLEQYHITVGDFLYSCIENKLDQYDEYNSKEYLDAFG